MEGREAVREVSTDDRTGADGIPQPPGKKHVKIGGAVLAVRQYLQAGLVDKMHLATSPVVIVLGEAIFSRLNLPALGCRVVDSRRQCVTDVTITSCRGNSRASVLRSGLSCDRAQWR